MPDNIRQQLKPFILRVTGNRDPAANAANARLIWDTTISILDGALSIGKQAPEYEIMQIREAVAAFETARQAGVEKVVA